VTPPDPRVPPPSPIVLRDSGSFLGGYNGGIPFPFYARVAEQAGKHPFFAHPMFFAITEASDYRSGLPFHPSFRPTSVKPPSPPSLCGTSSIFLLRAWCVPLPPFAPAGRVPPYGFAGDGAL